MAYDASSRQPAPIDAESNDDARPSDADPPMILGQEPVGPTAAALALLTAVLWGATPVAVSYSVDELPPVAVSGIRFALAAVFMLGWCRYEGCDLVLRRGQWKPTVIMGVLLFVQIVLFTSAIAESNSSHSTVLINSYLFWLAGIEHFITRTMRLTPLKVAGLLFAALSGATMLIEGGTPARPGVLDQASRWGDMLMLVSSFVLAIKIIYTKQATLRVEPGKLIFWHDVIGVALFFAWSTCFEKVSFTGLHAPTILGLLYQGVVVAGFCFAVQAQQLKRHSAATIAVFSMVSPVCGVLFANLFRGDTLSWWLLASAVCAAASIGLLNTRSSGAGRASNIRHPSRVLAAIIFSPVRPVDSSGADSFRAWEPRSSPIPPSRPPFPCRSRPAGSGWLRPATMRSLPPRGPG